jgi:hypothetical protein
VAAPSGSVPDRDALVMAFGDVVVPQLKGMAKAIYTGGRFVAVLDDTAVFSLDNAPTRERAEKYRPQVEQMLGEHFATPVPLRLVIESEAGAYETASPEPQRAPQAASDRPVGPEGNDIQPEQAHNPEPQAGQAQRTDAGAAESAPADTPAATVLDPVAEEAELMAHVDQLEDADVSTSGIDKLTEAFPGAQLIDTEESAG